MLAILVLALLKIPSASAQVPPPFLVQKNILGRTTSVALEAEAHPADAGASGSLSSVLFGRNLSLIRLDSSPAARLPAAEGERIASTQLTVGGVRIWSGELGFRQGALRYSGAIPPVRIPLPLLAYPLGPVLLRLDTGLEIEGKLEASLTPGLSLPAADSTIEAGLAADLAASGFVEGYGSLYVVRAGMEGRVDLIDGKAGVATAMYFDGSKPRSGFSGQAVFMRGEIEAFVDTHLPLVSWKRILSKKIFSWPGRCFAPGGLKCAAL